MYHFEIKTSCTFTLCVRAMTLVIQYVRVCARATVICSPCLNIKIIPDMPIFVSHEEKVFTRQ